MKTRNAAANASGETTAGAGEAGELGKSGKAASGAGRLRLRRARRGADRRFGTRALLLAGGIGGLGLAGFLALSWLQRAVALGQAPAAPMVTSPPAPAPQARPEKVKITFATVPAGVPTELRWGKRKLGIVNPTKPASKRAFFIERPKDSGPMDLVARAAGFLPLNTRVYTYADNRVTLRLTAETDKHTILGYKQEIPDAGADAGVAGGMAGADGGVMMPPPAVGPQLPAPLQPTPAPGPPLP